MTGFGRPPVAAVMAAMLLCEVRADLDADLFSFPVIRGRILFLRLWSQGGRKVSNRITAGFIARAEASRNAIIPRS